MAKYSRAFKFAAAKQYLNGTSSLKLGVELTAFEEIKGKPLVFVDLPR